MSTAVTDTGEDNRVVAGHLMSGGSAVPRAAFVLNTLKQGDGRAAMRQSQSEYLAWHLPGTLAEAAMLSVTNELVVAGAFPGSALGLPASRRQCLQFSKHGVSALRTSTRWNRPYKALRLAFKKLPDSPTYLVSPEKSQYNHTINSHRKRLSV